MHAASSLHSLSFWHRLLTPLGERLAEALQTPLSTWGADWQCMDAKVDVLAFDWGMAPHSATEGLSEAWKDQLLQSFAQAMKATGPVGHAVARKMANALMSVLTVTEPVEATSVRRPQWHVSVQLSSASWGWRSSLRAPLCELVGAATCVELDSPVVGQAVSLQCRHGDDHAFLRPWCGSAWLSTAADSLAQAQAMADAECLTTPISVADWLHVWRGMEPLAKVFPGLAGEAVNDLDGAVHRMMEVQDGRSPSEPEDAGPAPLAWGILPAQDWQLIEFETMPLSREPQNQATAASAERGFQVVLRGVTQQEDADHVSWRWVLGAPMGADRLDGWGAGESCLLDTLSSDAVGLFAGDWLMALGAPAVSDGRYAIELWTVDQTESARVSRDANRSEGAGQ